MKEFAEKFYKSQAWQNCRDAYMKKVNGLCEKCLELGLITPAEEVHHKIVLNPQNINDPNITLSFNNLIALCREHHRREHSKYKPRYFIDAKGEVHPL